MTKFDLFIVSVGFAILATLAILALLFGYGLTWLGSGSLVFVPPGTLRGGARPLFERRPIGSSSGSSQRGTPRLITGSALSARGRKPRPSPSLGLPGPSRRITVTPEPVTVPPEPLPEKAPEPTPVEPEKVPA